MRRGFAATNRMQLEKTLNARRGRTATKEGVDRGCCGSARIRNAFSRENQRHPRLGVRLDDLLIAWVAAELGSRT